MRIRRMSGTAGRGYTLVEMAIVLVIAGIILAIGVSSWMLLAEGRKNSSTYATMRRARDCIEDYVAQTGLYPAYSSDLAADPNFAVNICLNGKLDAWGEQIMFLEGIRDGGGTLASLCLLSTETASTDDPCSAEYAVTADRPPIKPDATSTITDKDGNTISDVAFVLISYGRQRNADHTSYGNLLDPAVVGVFASRISAGSQPDFSTTLLLNPREDDDIYMVVTYPELVSEVAKSRY